VKYFRDDVGIKLLGKRIREIRKSQNLSQSQLAFESGLPLKSIGNIELGKTNVGISSIFSIADALNVRPATLFSFDNSAL
jgi:transcriptional regulator with XRE-family HTH domain